MGDKQIPFFAYVDETGNTGHNLFDEVQPDFYTAALVTKGDFDLAFPDFTNAIAKKLGVKALHGKQLGAKRIDIVAHDILRLLSLAKAQFYVSRVEKRYLLATKVFDTFFDSGENAAVAWQHYNIRPLKLMLAFKLATCIDFETAHRFWDCVLEENEQKALEMIPGVCASLRANLANIRDAMSRQVLTDGLEWAEKHPECIHIHTDRRSARQGHFPNMVAFSNLLEGLEALSKRYKRPVARITHDRQSEFEQTLAAWHELYSNASPEEITWAGETYTLQRVVGSTFQVKADEESSGIQITDVILWLYYQSKKGTELPSGCTKLLEYASSNGWESDFSFDGVGHAMDAQFEMVMKAPFSAKQEDEARKMLAHFEVSRLRSMKQYEKDGVPPFMRSAPDRTDEGSVDAPKSKAVEDLREQ